MTYAIGDVHGMASMLRRLISSWLQDDRGTFRKLILLGDHIDRGPNSKQAVQFIRRLQRARPARVVCLRGNHEALVLAALEGGSAERLWLQNGGTATLRSYGVERVRDLPAEDLEWFRSLPTSHDDGLRLFVHAGIDPDRPLAQQRERDLLWIRNRFLDDERDHGRFIVHGHTPLRTGVPDLRHNRVNLDTGAGYGGPLTAAVFNDTDAKPISFIQARP
jgi:serine/threonine protein phosphatase 1